MEFPIYCNCSISSAYNISAPHHGRRRSRRRRASLGALLPVAFRVRLWRGNEMSMQFLIMTWKWHYHRDLHTHHRIARLLALLNLCTVSEEQVKRSREICGTVVRKSAYRSSPVSQCSTGEVCSSIRWTTDYQAARSWYCSPREVVGDG